MEHVGSAFRGIHKNIIPQCWERRRWNVAVLKPRGIKGTVLLRIGIEEDMKLMAGGEGER